MDKEALTEAEITTLQNLVKHDKLTPASSGPLELARVEVQTIMDRMAKTEQAESKSLKGISGVPDEVKQMNDNLMNIYGLIGRAPAQSRNLVRAVR